MGILLASYATMIQPLDWLSAASNLVLSVTGILLMLRPGWNMPGIASLLGTYAAFAGWQLFGAAGNDSGDAHATLWFLPASWAIFAIPGMLGRFRETLGERGRAIFTAANNGLYFLIFTVVWLNTYGNQGFWKVPAVFGFVLLILGALGRKWEDSAAASNFLQGLAGLSLAVVLKFDGYHLGLALAGESLVLALAFHRFHKWPEYAFAMLAGMGAVIVSVFLHLFPSENFPLWSGVLAAVLVVLAAGFVRLNVGQTTRPTPQQVRAGASLLAYSSLAILLFGGCYRLPIVWQLPMLAGFAVSFSALSLFIDRRRWMVEIAWASGISGILALSMITSDATRVGSGFALCAAIVACAIWHRPPTTEDSSPFSELDPVNFAQPFSWLFALLAPLLFGKLIFALNLSDHGNIGALAMGAIVLAITARLLKADSLGITSILPNMGALALVIPAVFDHSLDLSKAFSFAPAAGAAGILILSAFQPGEKHLLQIFIARGMLFVAWGVAILVAFPEGFIDLVALSAGAGFFWAWRRERSAPVEAWGWLMASLAALIFVWIEGNASILHGYSSEGMALVVLLGAIAIKTPRLPEILQISNSDNLAKVLPWLACLVLSIWSTHLIVVTIGWKAVVILWTVLGFGLVLLGLMLGRITSRQTGFVLLTAALLKLFLVDVWDFSTVMRIISFIALGIALVILGFFYHRFAPALKRLIDDDTPRPPLT